METAVQKLTSMPAMRLGISDRGVLRPGLYADITVFDADTVIDRETFGDSHAFPAGIEFVIVNGQLVVEPQGQTNSRPGMVL
jgi:N-acyl-D-aspartate/D-glutamate deacylase